MSLLFKAELRGHTEPMAKAAFVIEDLKKGLSDEVRNLLDKNKIDIKEDFTELPIPDKWKEKLEVSPNLEEDIPKIIQHGKDTDKPDYNKFITVLFKYIEVFDELLSQQESIEEAHKNNVDIENIRRIHDSELVDASIIDGQFNNSVFKRIQSARSALKKLMDKLDSQLKEGGELAYESSGRYWPGYGKRQDEHRRDGGTPPQKPPLYKQLDKLFLAYSRSEDVEDVKNKLIFIDKDYKFFNQKKLSSIWERYDKGNIPPNIMNVLNKEYRGKTGIELLKQLATELNFSATYLEDTTFSRLKDYMSVDIKNEIDKLDEILDEDANIETTRQLFSDKKYPLTKIEDIADKLEDRLFDLDEGEEPVYSYEDNEEVNEDIRNTEMSRLVNYYSVLYYVADLRGKKLNKKMLNWDGHEIGIETLPDRFPIITDTFNATQEEE